MLELKACEPCQCCEVEKGVTLIIDTDKGMYDYYNVREYEVSTFVDYYRRTMKVKEVKIKY